MVFRIIDASAFYAGIPFSSSNEFYTTSLIFDEIKHIKKNHGAIDILLATNRLKIQNPSSEFIDIAIEEYKKTGDFNHSELLLFQYIFRIDNSFQIFISLQDILV